MCLGTSHLQACQYEGGQMPPLSSSGCEGSCINFQVCSVSNFPPSDAKPFHGGLCLKTCSTKEGWEGDICIRAKAPGLGWESLQSKDVSANQFLFCTRLLKILLPDTTEPKFYSTAVLCEEFHSKHWSWFRSCETWCLIPHSKRCHTSHCASVSPVIKGE